jgi:hypothetical protein
VLTFLSGVSGNDERVASISREESQKMPVRSRASVMLIVKFISKYRTLEFCDETFGVMTERGRAGARLGPERLVARWRVG